MKLITNIIYFSKQKKEQDEARPFVGWGAFSTIGTMLTLDFGILKTFRLMPKAWLNV